MGAVSDKLKPNYGAGFLLEVYHRQAVDSRVRSLWNNLDCTLTRSLLGESCLQGLRKASSGSAGPGKGAMQRDENKGSEARPKTATACVTVKDARRPYPNLPWRAWKHRVK